MTLGFRLDREKRFFLEVLFYIQQLRVPLKTVVGSFKIAMCLQNQHILCDNR